MEIEPQPQDLKVKVYLYCYICIILYSSPSKMDKASRIQTAEGDNLRTRSSIYVACMKKILLENVLFYSHKGLLCSFFQLDYTKQTL